MDPHVLMAYPITFVDTGMHMNQAMFEQTGCSGYVLKPALMWDKNNPLFGYFNPWEKEFDNLQPSYLTIFVSIINNK